MVAVSALARITGRTLLYLYPLFYYRLALSAGKLSVIFLDQCFCVLLTQGGKNALLLKYGEEMQCTPALSTPLYGV